MVLNNRIHGMGVRQGTIGDRKTVGGSNEGVEHGMKKIRWIRPWCLVLVVSILAA
jgi:hypothetical protein